MRLNSLALIFLLVLANNAKAAVITFPHDQRASFRALVTQPLPFSFIVKFFKRPAGRKFSLKTRILNRIFLYEVKKGVSGSGKGKWALILGIAGLVMLLLPNIVLLSLPCAIAAVVLGYAARRTNRSDKKAKAGIILGWITIGLFVAALVIVITTLHWN